MKLNELKEILSDLGYIHGIKDDNFVVYSNEKLKTRNEYKMIGQVSLVEPFNMRTYISDPMLLTYLFNFSKTKLSEREEEKKYQLKVNEFNKRIIGVDYIEQINTKIKGTPDGNQKFIFDNKDVFTQSEIDNLPQEIRGAIECGFLRKVKVE